MLFRSDVQLELARNVFAFVGEFPYLGNEEFLDFRQVQHKVLRSKTLRRDIVRAAALTFVPEQGRVFASSRPR